LTRLPVYIAAAGIVSPLGRGLAATELTLRQGVSALAPLRLFPVLHGEALPVGQVAGQVPEDLPPRTHRLACEAVRMILADCPTPPEAVLLGCTTGGILATEELLRGKSADKQAYRFHGLHSVVEEIADLCHCSGPAITVSTACSSSAVAIALAMRMLQSGGVQSILVGGADSLSHLTYCGFHSLQLVDRQGCRPGDISRQGMSVAEGAAMLLLTTVLPEKPLAVVLGAGLSCDAHHATAPHPAGKGALQAMQHALADAGLDPRDIDYINLHGTATPDNDLAEARAITALFPVVPALSSIKGATGHSLAAAGAIEAVVATLAVARSFIPGNTGCRQPDPALGLMPQAEPLARPVRTVLSNSFGFGGNNGSLVIGQVKSLPIAPPSPEKAPLAVHGIACLTGAGLTEATLGRFQAGQAVAGMIATEELAAHLPTRLVRRMKRLSRLGLLLAINAHADVAQGGKPSAVFMGTGWGALSETVDFLQQLDDTGQRFPSPTDFVGSVHNGVASQIAIHFGATGANVTTSGGDYSFEQALLAADSLLENTGQSALLLAADEGHERLSPLLDPSIQPGSDLADGGGALYVSRDSGNARCLVSIPFYQKAAAAGMAERLIEALGGAARIAEEFAALFVGIPRATAEQGNRQLADFLARIGSPIPVWPYRQFTGEFASAAAVAAVLAVSSLESGVLPLWLTGGESISLGAGRKILVLGTGRYLTAMECARR